MLRLIFVLTVLLLGPNARADSWALPSETTYESADASARFTVTPRDLDSQLSYFEGRAQGEPPRGLIEVSDGSGGWTRVWQIELVNEVAPVSAIVAPGGRYIVTFDNWHMAGFGEHVVVIYNAEGRVVRSLTLLDLLPAQYIEALPRSVSSISWAGRHRISNDTLLLQILVPSEDDLQTRPTYVELPVDLSSGRVRAHQTAAWGSAVAQAERVAAARSAAAQRAEVAFREPLVAPGSSDEREWHLYLVELFFRLEWSPDPGYPAVNVLRSPQRADYAPSERWLCEKFRERGGPVLMLASPASPANLQRVLRQCFQSPYAADFERIYLVVPPEYQAAITAILQSTGAQIIAINPNTPVPQHPGRLAARDSR